MKRLISAGFAPVLAISLALISCQVPAQAQTTSATVVSSCGTPPSTYTAGANRALTQDTTGTLCASSGGGGGGNVTITGPLGTQTLAASVATTTADGNDVAQGAKADAAVTNPASSGSVIALIKGLISSVQGAIPAGTNGIGYLVGATPYGSISTASTNATSIKGSAGTLTALNPVNTTTTIAYLRLYNLASAPTCSSATGYVATVPVPPAGASGGAGGIAAALGSGGLTFSTGIAYCLTGGGSSTDNTNAPAGVYLLAGYR